MKDTAIAITGGDLTPVVNGEPLPMWETVYVGEGDIIAFGSRQSGCRSYLAAAGGFDVPPVLGARSANTRIGIGGTDGRPLRQGDLLKVPPACLHKDRVLELPPVHRPAYERNVNLRVLPGPHFRLFTQSSVNDFTGVIFNVSEQADRMGVVLKGKNTSFRGLCRTAKNSYEIIIEHKSCLDREENL